MKQQASILLRPRKSLMSHLGAHPLDGLHAPNSFDLLGDRDHGASAGQATHGPGSVGYRIATGRKH